MTSKSFLEKIVSDEDGEMMMNLRWREIQRMARELLALQWRPITPEDLPKVGDELLSSEYASAQFPERVCAECGEYAGVDIYRKYMYTHFRSINPLEAYEADRS